MNKILLNILLRIYLQKRLLNCVIVCFCKRRFTMEISSSTENKLNAILVLGITFFIIIFWFIIIPSA